MVDPYLFSRGDMQMIIFDWVHAVKEGNLIFGQFFEKPKCKPWDLAKGRRMRCCHGLGEHTQWCFESGKTIHIPQYGAIDSEQLCR